ncbi:MAG: AIR synthase-related protein, partial [Verrucomicrobiota bacterium]
LAEGCRAFNTPVTGGNVSLYNENPSGPIDPTPTVGMVGMIENEKHITTQSFKNDGDVVILIGGDGSELGASHYLKVVHGRKEGLPPRVDYQRELAMHDALRALIRSGFVKSAHDCSEGGLAVTLAECCISGSGLIGAAIDFGNTGLRADQLLFNESQSRVVISVQKANAAAVLALLEWRGVTARRIGTVGGKALEIRADGGYFTWDTGALYNAWYFAIRNCMS